MFFRSIAVSIIVASGAAFGAIVVEGIEDKEVYTNSVAFRVVPAAGYDDTALLDGVAVPVGTQVQVRDVRYHELVVERRHQTSGATETATIRFIVRSSARGSAENGLPPWVPYPTINSAAAEFAGATLAVIMPDRYPQGLELPIVAWVENGQGKRVGVNGWLTASEIPNHTVHLLRGVGSGFLPPQASGGVLSYTAQVGPLAAPNTVTVEDATTWTAVSGNLGASADWGENARVHLTSTVTVAAGATLRIGAGSVIKLGPAVDLSVNGTLIVNGSRERPVVFTAETRSAPCGSVLVRGSSASATMTGAILTAACADPNWFDNHSGSGSTHLSEQPLLYFSGGARVTLTDCYLIDSPGQAGHGESSTFSMTRCLYQRFVHGGQYNSCTVTLVGCALIGFPSDDIPFEDDDMDGIYFTGGEEELRECLLGWTHDDCLDAGSGQGSRVRIYNCWIEGAHHEGLAWSSDSGDRLPDVRDTVTINCGQGIEAGWGEAKVEADRCLSTANVVGARFGDNYDWDYEGYLHVRNSLLLHNERDIWGRAWDTWEEHLSQMDVRDNLLTRADPLHPANGVWDPDADASRLEPFLPAPDDVVGIGIATWSDLLKLNEVPRGVPVRLSTFTRKRVSVAYEIVSEGGALGAGTLTFAPGETVKRIPVEVADPNAYEFIQVAIDVPVNAELTDRTAVTFAGSGGVALIAQGSEWRYWDRGSFPGAGWTGVGFDDGGWDAGPAELGFGDDDEATEIEGGPSDERYSAAYFRRTFDVPDPSRVTALTINLRRDDGAVVYINGTEVFRTNMPNGAIAYGTWASSSDIDEDAFNAKDVNPSVLVAGTNVVACEVHQANETSSDLSFELELLAVMSAPTGPAFVRGDANGDAKIDLSDAIKILQVLFSGVATDCADAIDADDNGVMGIGDAIRVLSYLFSSGGPLPPPFPLKGKDPSDDGLTCERR